MRVLIALLLFIPVQGYSAKKVQNCTRSGSFEAGRCYQACMDESGVSGSLDKAGKCFCRIPMPLEYMNAKKYRAKAKLEGTSETDTREEISYGNDEF